MNRIGKTGSLLLITIFYLLASFIIYIIFPFLPGGNLFQGVLYADLIATAVIFIFSVMLNNSSTYDPYWSVAPPVIAGYLVYINPEGDRVRQLIVFFLVVFWGTRLTLNWARGWKGLQHQDWRYRNLQKQSGKFYWPVSFLGIHMMPTLLVYLGCLPLFYIMADPAPIGNYEWIAVVFTLGATFLEWTADEQLRAFKRHNAPTALMQSGLWSILRHPNYTGEVSFWLGLFLFIPLGTTPGSEWTLIGFLSMVALFTFISVPMMDRHNLQRREGYAEHMKKIPALVPFSKWNRQTETTE